jgi:hypothetical protein
MKVFREFLIKDHAHYSYDMQRIAKYYKHYYGVESYMSAVEEYLDLEEFGDVVRIGKLKNIR